MISFLKYNLNPPKSPEEIAHRITEKIAAVAFKFYQRADFRRLIDFEIITQTEQDRIFNEVLVSGLCVAILSFEILENRTNKERSQQFYRELQIELLSRYPNWLRELGTSQEFVELWRKLILMRTEEYREDYQLHKKELEKSAEKYPFVFVVAIGGHHHLRRGKAKPEDPLFKMFLHWVIEVTNESLKVTEKSLGWL